MGVEQADGMLTDIDGTHTVLKALQEFIHDNPHLRGRLAEWLRPELCRLPLWTRRFKSGVPQKALRSTG